jgi:hypothetical protein
MLTQTDITTGGYRNSYAPGAAPETEEFVTETFDLFITASTYALLQTAIQTINRHFLRVERRRNYRSEWPTFLRILPSGYTAGEEYISEIVDGYFSYDPSALNATGFWPAKIVKTTVSITRRNAWVKETAIQTNLITNANSGTTAPIYNCGDGNGSSPTKRLNYGLLPYATTIGDLPGLLYVNMNNTLVGETIRKVWATNSLYSAAGPVELIEAESGTTAAGSMLPASPDYTNYSGGKYLYYTLTDGTEQEACRWLGAFSGMRYHIMARFTENTSLGNIKFRLRVLSGTTVLWQGEQFSMINPTETIQDLGVVLLPPADKSYFNFTAGLRCSLSLMAQRTTGVTETIKLDYLMLFPADQFQIVNCMVDTAYTNSLVFGENSEGEQIYRNVGGTYYNDLITIGNPITILPKADNYITVLWIAAAGGSEVVRTATLTGGYFPRRRVF